MQQNPEIREKVLGLIANQQTMSPCVPPNRPTTSDKKSSFTPLVIFLLALAVKFAIYSIAADHTLFVKYPFFAQKIGDGLDIGERILDISPFYLYLSALFYKMFGPNWQAFAVVQLCIGSLNCVAVYYIGRRIFGAGTGILAAAILMLYGNLTLIELTLEPETVALLFNSLVVIALMKAGDAAPDAYRSWRWLLAGMLIGFAAITKANAILLLPGAFVWILLTIETLGNRSRAVVFLLVGATLIVSPVTIRNYILFHDVVLITADGGKVFFHGNGPGASGMNRSDLAGQFVLEEAADEPDYAHALFRKEARSISHASLKPSECSDFWFARTVHHIKTHPLSALLLGAKKIGLFWNNYEVHDLDPTYKNYVTLRKWPFVTMGMIAGLGILGMVFSVNRFRRAFLPYWMVFIYLCSVLVFFSASRYRLPAVPFLSIFAAQFLMSVSLFIRRKEVKKTALSLVLLLLILAGSYLPFRGEIKQYDLWQQATRIHYVQGKLLYERHSHNAAVQELERAVSLAPDFAMLYMYLGKSYAILGEYQKAEMCFDRFISLSPQTGEGYLNLGFLNHLRGEEAKARTLLEKGLLMNPGNARAKKTLETIKARMAADNQEQ